LIVSGEKSGVLKSMLKKIFGDAGTQKPRGGGGC
jgi:hypothetical protein